MEIQISRWQKKETKSGVVASFDARTDAGITIRGMTLIRPSLDSGEIWLRPPKTVSCGRDSVGLSPSVRAAIGERAAAMYAAASGIKLKFTAPPPLPRNEPDAGLRKMLGADVKDSLAMSGLDR